MFCSQCGKSLPDDSKFCRHCGAAQNVSPGLPPTAFPAHQTDDQERIIKEAGVHLVKTGPSALMAQRKLIVTNHRVIYREGLVGKKERSIPLSKIQDVTIKYTIAGRVVGYGTLRIESAGNSETEIVAEDIADAKGIRDTILNLIR